MDVVNGHSQASFLAHVQKAVTGGSDITTDGFSGYNNLNMDA